jgi:Ca2+-binding RTX toxin-like protein
MLGSEFVRRISRVFAPLRWMRLRPAAFGALLLVASLMAVVGTGVRSARAAIIPTGSVAPSGSGFTVTAGDLSFILKQIKIAERHSATFTSAEPCSTLVGPGPDQIPDRLTSYGLRTVDGSCNNLIPGNEHFASADQPFPRLAQPVFNDAEPAPPGFPAQASSSYKQKKGLVYDSRPRVISNLIVDQTSTNPSAVHAAKFPVRTQGNEGIDACTTDPVPANNNVTPPTPEVLADPPGCTPSHKTLFIPNVTTDVGLSPPYNSVFTFFGQFFDHGVDQTVKSGGTVFVPLKADDPLRTLGPDGDPNTPDQVPPSQAFMVLTRAQNQPGPDGILGDHSPNPNSPVACTAATRPNCDGSADDVQNANNTDSPWVDQSQTYTSHPSHQVFLREYAVVGGHPASTGKLLGGPTVDDPATTDFDESAGATGMSTWSSVKKQAAEVLGLKLTDYDVTNIPMLATDPYGEFIPGPARGLPQYALQDGSLVEGNTAGGGVPVPANVKHFDTPFLTDIAHNADPSPQDTDNNPGTPPIVPIPDADHVANADFANQPVGTYDDEGLNRHFCAGDGRVNENIALSAVHQIFHSEHDRLVDDINNTLHQPANAALLAAYQAAHPFGASADISFGFGGRLFQAARFVTEMEYQHLVFEEFARKIQPAVRPFHVYHSDINAAIPAEFAHAVYRFGHSMLDDTVARTREDPVTGAKIGNDVSLLTGFLNPTQYFKDKDGDTMTPDQAAGSIFMGSSDQTGNELDEFVTETLRNNLLGLPLDLPTINMTRAREAGVPSLNNLRRKIFADTSDGQLAPYTSWVDFGEHLKHPESLVNFVAAYGTHQSITSVNTAAAKRAAAQAIVDEAADPAAGGPADSVDFMNSSGPYANDANDVTVTGVDDVDLWVGGLAEITNINGGLLGTTFNYVFQNTLENLQDGDRLYYLARTPGLNLRTQLEGNSFSELIQRNTDGTHSLKADAFSTADCRFELKNLAGTAAAFTASGATVADDPNSQCDESKLLLRKPDGTIQYRAFNTLDPPGINGQSVYNGTSGNDRVAGGNDNDTFWGGLGNDRIEGQAGDDIALGGDGRDTLTDLGGADVLKGGPGNDSIDSGTGDDIMMGGDGADFMNGGGNDNESFGGPGGDFIQAGQGADAVFGDGGDDWIQGGSGQDLLQGDHAAPFFDDPGEVAPGNDVMVGQVGENDYDTEGGDDLMAQNSAIDRNAGSGGFDWAFHQYNTIAADDDMAINNNLLGLQLPIVVNRDRWQETEGDSGSKFNDLIKGDDDVPSTLGGGGFTGCDVLDAAGLARIKGLNAIVPPLTGALQPVLDNSATGACPLSGPIWGEGNILLGGGGSDVIQGRGGDDIIDGDRQLTVRMSVRSPTNHATEIGSTDLMEHQYLRTATGALTGPTLQNAVAAGTVNPSDVEITREITTATEPGVDTAVFAATRADYTVTFTANGRVLVTQTGPLAVGQKVSDGTDTLRNIEKLQFSDQTLNVAVPNAPTNVAATPGNASANVTWTRTTAAACGCPAITSQEIVVTSPTGTQTITGILPGATSRNVTGLTNNTPYTFQVRAVNDVGPGPLSVASAPVTPKGPPDAPTAVTTVRGNAQITVNWLAPANDGGSPITGYEVQVRTGAVQVGAILASPGTGLSKVVTGLTNGTAYNFRVRAINALGTGVFSAASANVTFASTPGAPVLLAPAAGAAGGALTAAANWNPPTDTGGAAITGYKITPLLMAADGVTVATRRDDLAFTGGAALRTRSFTLPAGTYRFEVVAINAIGNGTPGVSDTVSPA